MSAFAIAFLFGCWLVGFGLGWIARGK